MEKCYITFHFPQHWLADMLQRRPDFLETFEALLSENPKIVNEPFENNRINGQLAACDYTDVLLEVGQKLEKKFHMEEPWQTIYIGPAKLTCIQISPEIHCREEILAKNPFCFLEMMENLPGVDGVVKLMRDGNEISVYIYEDNEQKVLDFLEKYMEESCQIDDPYHLLDVTAAEEKTKRRIENYIQAYNERLVDQLFEELEQRLMED